MEFADTATTLALVAAGKVADGEGRP